tara:strand:+ start:9490 stop:10365 length:876 start_codon:yes stop_codon:yes gene_type:complete
LIEKTEHFAWDASQLKTVDPLWIDGSDDMSSIVDMATQSLHHYGFALLRNFCGDAEEASAAARLTMLGQHLGTIVPQSPRGELVENVRDFSDIEAEDKRGYRSAGELTPHSDPPTLIALYCLQPAMTGGESYLVNVRSIHDCIARKDQALLQELYKPFPHWRVEGTHGIAEAGPYEIERPIFCQQNGQVSCVYYRPFIELSARTQQITLNETQIAALDLFDHFSKSNELALRTTLQQGEVVIAHNRTVLHARTNYQDWPKVQDRRHLLRIWIDSPERFPVQPQHELGDLFA